MSVYDVERLTEILKGKSIFLGVLWTLLGLIVAYFLGNSLIGFILWFVGVEIIITVALTIFVFALYFHQD